ncbi:YjaG family protein [Pseudidiomarina terrestris]|uniref:YjaG family protein n=1 Tax=Pseudidiomarina terrestris TaxID=2820060 RepID=A0AAW7R4Z9_9GAMM|nr:MULTISPECIES: YjaG family protein [unclassified Pseudidiomarina]MDN7125599.1 YjaG family protein [Pseudidiomarina sp. 1APP75-32.1]MDN7130538.1 YjaG family protein [Pseudidiomarina sp. 1APR75-15]MDN7134179.1 YjaG family protein [Pseudidiomarina sp. 1ASP75-5]MDN7137134.1 YjaG family protein [Pseudidiomarina sp. 1ASP75-14]MEA3588393.1 YjaG family protein [Pseudidiomarina sp. 1APP75-27a]
MLNTFQRFRELNFNFQVLAALYLCERMYPNYELFHQVTGFGDPKPLRGALNACWDWSWQGKKVKVNFARWQEKIDDVTPSEYGHDMLGVYPAMDACTAISTMLESLLDPKTADLVSVAKVSQASVAKFLELTEGAELEAEARRELVREHELAVYEVEVQQALLDFLEAMQRSADAPTQMMVRQLQEMVVTEGITNIGMERDSES